MIQNSQNNKVNLDELELDEFEELEELDSDEKKPTLNEEPDDYLDQTRENDAEIKDLEQELEALTLQLSQAKDREARAFADYQNLVRRTQEEKKRLYKVASKDFVEAILQPLEHLSMATEQLNDKGLSMVVDQLWRSLEQQGLKEIDALGKKFDLETMEVVDKEGDGEKVVKIVTRGYRLHDEVVKHVKVILG